MCIRDSAGTHPHANPHAHADAYAFSRRKPQHAARNTCANAHAVGFFKL